MDLENGGGRSYVRERGLNATGGVRGESGLYELPLELIRGSCRGFQITRVLLRDPLATGALADEGVHSHG